MVRVGRSRNSGFNPRGEEFRKSELLQRFTEELGQHFGEDPGIVALYGMSCLAHLSIVPMREAGCQLLGVFGGKYVAQTSLHNERRADDLRRLPETFNQPFALPLAVSVALPHSKIGFSYPFSRGILAK